MSFFDSVEKKLEGAMNTVFARTFKGEVQVVEITARLERELDANATVLNRDEKLVPNGFSVTLSDHDYSRLVPYSKTMSAEITQQLNEYAAEHNYIFNGPITIDYIQDAKLPVGKMKVVSQAVAGVSAPDEPVVPPTAPRRNTLFVEVNGVRHQLTPPGLTIGRGNDADLRINDPGISRIHARIVVNPGDDGLACYIEDLQSTNGIKVDGVKVERAELHEGSTITLGKTTAHIVGGANV
ncbi:MAG: FHA domain-containing protein [Propionibacteriaceae bacterium]|jgi:hypothetical protein|nr:FHA domain-containing protein [Propionibacteriaceae bacterium]